MHVSLCIMALLIILLPLLLAIVLRNAYSRYRVLHAQPRRPGLGQRMQSVQGKRPTLEAKETYSRSKRDLLLPGVRPGLGQRIPALHALHLRIA